MTQASLAAEIIRELLAAEFTATRPEDRAFARAAIAETRRPGWDPDEQDLGVIRALVGEG